MTRTTWEPDPRLPALVALTTLLGEPRPRPRHPAEGNTSELLDDGRLVVKASGAGLALATAEDFVVVDVDEVAAVVDDPTTIQADLSAVLVASGTDRPDGAGPRAAPSRRSCTPRSTPRPATPGSWARRASSPTPTRPRSSGCWPASAPRRHGPVSST